MITSFFPLVSQDPQIVVISDDEQDLGSQNASVAVIPHPPVEIEMKNGIRIEIPFVVGEDGQNVFESVS